MKDDYIVLAANAVEGNRLRNNHWVPSKRVATVPTLHRGALAGFAGDVFYTDAALELLVDDAQLRDTGQVSMDPDSGKHSPIMAEGRNWRAWRTARRSLRSVHPFEAWLHLYEASQEELAERRMGFVSLVSQATIPAEQLEYRMYPLDLINARRLECSAAVRAEAANRLVRIAPSRVVVTEHQSPAGDVTVSATWTARAAANRAIPSWLVSGLDLQSSAGV